MSSTSPARPSSSSLTRATSATSPALHNGISQFNTSPKLARTYSTSSVAMPSSPLTRATTRQASQLDTAAPAASSSTSGAGGRTSGVQAGPARSTRSQVSDLSLARSILPSRGEAHEADEAVAKLERMSKAKESKKKWKKAVGVGALTPKKSKKQRQEEEEKDSSSDESLDLSRAFNEVKLAISSLPGYPINLASKAKGLASRRGGGGGAHDGRASADIEDCADDDTHSQLGYGGSFRFGGVRRRRHGTAATAAATPALTPSSERALPGFVAPTSSSTAPPAVQAAPTLVQPQPVHAEATLGFDLTRSRSVLASPDLGAVHEEVPSTSIVQPSFSSVAPTPLPDVAEVPQAPPPLTSPAKQQRPVIDTQPLASGSRTGTRPFVMIQSATELDMQGRPVPRPSAEGRSLLEPPTSPCHGAEGSSSSTSVLGGAMHAEPLGESDGEISEASSSDGEEGVNGRGYASDSSSFAGDDPVALSLEHGAALSKKERRRVQKLSKRTTRQGSMNDGSLRAAALARGELITDKVTRGLNYVSNESRNRRAMERYSPAPQRTGSVSYPNTPVAPSRSATFLTMAQGNDSVGGLMPPQGISRAASPSNVGAAIQRPDSMASSRRSSMTESLAPNMADLQRTTSPDPNEALWGEKWSLNDAGFGMPKRWNTSKASLAGDSVKSTSLVSRLGSRGAKLLSLRRKMQDKLHHAEKGDEEEVATPRQEDPEKELDAMLGKLIAQEAPEQAGERFEYDVLYENQRGLLVFGIPKFSARTLFQWDPSPWTNARNGNSAYNIVNAQLPDPSWEWVHPEWLIDMSGHVDEAGWQYSGNFGKLGVPHFKRPSQPLPRTGAEGAVEMNERIRAEQKKADDGLHALKENAKARSAKWSGHGDAGTFVRRRRWIRLRRRRPLLTHGALAAAAASPSRSPNVGSPMSMGSQDVGKLMDAEVERANAAAQKEVRSDELSSDDEADAALALSDFEEDEDDEVDSDGHAVAQDGANASDFLPRRTPGNFNNHSADPMEERRNAKQERRQRHAREFTGSVRELKSLLPAIMDKPHKTAVGRHTRASASTGAAVLPTASSERARLWLSEIDARNPFISWAYVKKRLDDDDLAFASASLRARARRYAQHAKTREERTARRLSAIVAPPEKPAEPSASIASPEPQFSAAGFAAAPTPAELSQFGAPALPSSGQVHDLTRDALVEINFRRVLRIMRACKLDRHKLQLWRIWLGQEMSQNAAEPPRREDLAELGLLASPNTQSDSLIRARENLAGQARAKWKATGTTPDLLDVWDVLERRLDRILLVFEFQGSRATLIKLLLTIHATSHPEHRFKRSDWGLKAHDGQTAHPDVPSVLSPLTQRQNTDGTTVAPRLEFWSDLERIARGVLDAPPPGVALHDRQQREEAESGNPNAAILDSPQFGPVRAKSPSLPAHLLSGGSISRPPSRTTTPKPLGGSLNSPRRAATHGTPTSSSNSALAPPSRSTLSPSPSSTLHKRTSPSLQQGEADRAFLKRLLEIQQPEKRRDALVGQAKLDADTASSDGNAAAAAIAPASSLAPTSTPVAEKCEPTIASPLPTPASEEMDDFKLDRELSNL